MHFLCAILIFLCNQNLCDNSTSKSKFYKEFKVIHVVRYQSQTVLFYKEVLVTVTFKCSLIIVTFFFARNII